jgi:IclR family pca regulon transcriptional regulator
MGGTGKLSARGATTKRLHEDDSAFVTSLARGLKLLGAFTPDRPKLSFGELCGTCDLPRTTVHRLLGTLLGLDFLVFDEESRRYFPGPRAVSIGVAALNSMDMRERVRPYLLKLFQILDETISFAVQDRAEIVIFERVATRRIIAVDLSIGARLPIHNTSMGRCLLAFLPERERDDLIAELRHGLLGEADYLKLRRAVDQGLKRGYTISDQEFAPGLLAIACPVWDSNNRIFGAVNVALPAFRATLKQIEETVLPPLQDTARRISLSYGASEIWIDGGWRNDLTA